MVVAGNHHRQNHVPDGVHIPEAERLERDPNAERRLHTEVYFLALAIRRVHEGKAMLDGDVQARLPERLEGEHGLAP